MAKITITEAAKLAGISRQHLYRGYINKGNITVSKDNDKSYIDMSELLRVFPDVKLVTENSDVCLHETTVENDNTRHSDSELINLLKNQLCESKEREQWLIKQIDELRRQQNNLLENKDLKETSKSRKKFLGIF